MRKVPVITLASLVAVLGLVAAPVYSATLFGTDTPDVRLAPGETAPNVFDLDDFFDSSAAASIGYTQDGAAVADGVVTIMGAAAPGSSMVKFAASAAGESLEAESTVVVSNGIIANVPDINNNNRIAGAAGGNAFLNGIAPGAKVMSAEALKLVSGGDFSSLTGASATGSAALLATIGEVTVSQAESGLYVRSSAIKAAGDGSASFGGLTASVASNGTYELSAGADFMGPVVVTLGSTADAVHVLAAKSTGVDIAAMNQIPAGDLALGTINIAGGKATITVAPGQGALFVANNGVAVGDAGTLSLNYKATGTSAAIFAVAFDAAAITSLSGTDISYAQVAGGAIEANAMKNLAVSSMPASGSILAGFQIANAASSTETVTVEISDLSILNVGALADYALNPNANALADDLSDISGQIVDIAGAGAVAGSASTDNNFASVNGAASMQLAATAAAPANGAIVANLAGGTVVAECWVKKASGDAGVFFLHVTNGLGNVMETEKSVAKIGSTWEKVITSGVFPAGAAYVVLQNAGGASSVVVDDVVVRQLTDSAKVFDAGLMQ